MNENNLIAKMFNLTMVKQRIADCPSDEVVILCPQWSINKPAYSDSDLGAEAWDMEEFEKEIGASLYISDYNDLIADPHGIYN